MKNVIPEVEPMKGKEIKQECCGLPKKLTSEEQDKVEKALDDIVFAYYTVWFGYPIRPVKDIKKDLAKAKQSLSEIKCPEVI